MEELYIKFAFPSASRFYEILKENGVKATHAQVKEFISKQAVSQIHKPIKDIKSNHKNITATELNEIWQIDLLDYSKYSQQNKGFHWCLIIVDFFTRKAYAEPVKNKTPPSVLDAFKKIITTDNKPKVIYADEGNEWKGSFNEFIKNNNIVKLEDNSKNHHSFAIIDRFSRTIKTMIAKYMTGNNTTKWVDELPHLIQIYNNSKHSGIDNIKPNQAETPKNQEIISNINWTKKVQNSIINNKTNDFKIGDTVRVKQKKSGFSKGYSATYSKKIYTVIGFDNTNIIKLNDEKKYNAKDLLFVPFGSSIVNSGIQEQADKDAILKRKLRLEGLI